jgi:AcrR family transcriptional regulator
MVDVATSVFGNRGFAAASMDEIAASAGITKPMLYAYFDSKEGLFAACAAKAGAALRERVRATGERSELPPDERLWQGILTVFDFVEEYSEGWAVLYPSGGQPGGAIGSAGREARHAMEELLTGLFEQAAREAGIAPQATAHIGALAVGFTAATIAMASDWLERGEEPKELQALRLMNLAWMGFGSMVEGKLWLPGAPS